jgi:hypothetical protein
VQVQRWLGHHSPAFTLAAYVHLLPDDIPAPLDLPNVEQMEPRSRIGSGRRQARQEGPLRRVGVAAVLLSAVAVSGCGSSKGGSSNSGGSTSASSQSANFDISKKTTKNEGVSGRLVALQGTLATVSGQELDGEGNAKGPTVTRTVKLFSSAVEGMKVGDQVYFATGPAGGFAQDKARNKRNNGETQTVLTESSTCGDWEKASQPVQFAFVKKFVTEQGAQPTAGVIVAGWIAGKCAEHSESQIGALAAESLSK